MSKLDQFECLLIGCSFLLNGFDDNKDLHQVFLNNLQHVKVHNANDSKKTAIEKARTALTRHHWEILAPILQCNLREWQISNDSRYSSAQKQQFRTRKNTSEFEPNFQKIVVRLSMLLFATIDKIHKFVFVQVAATKIRKTVTDEMQYYAQQQQRAYEFLSLKKLLDNEIKSLVIKIGCFINSKLIGFICVRVIKTHLWTKDYV